MLGQYLAVPLFDLMTKQLARPKHARSMSEEGVPLLSLPSAETLMSIVLESIPVLGSICQQENLKSFLSTTIDVLVRRNDIMVGRVIMQLINEAFNALDESTRCRPIPLVDLDLDSLDLEEETERKEDSNPKKMNFSKSMNPLEFANCIGLETCVDALEVLFNRTKCERYKPSLLLQSMAKARKLQAKDTKAVASSRSMRNLIKSVASQMPIRRRLSSLFLFSSLPVHKRSKSLIF